MEEPLWVSHQRLAEVPLGWAVGLFTIPVLFLQGIIDHFLIVMPFLSSILG